MHAVWAILRIPARGKELLRSRRMRRSKVVDGERASASDVCEVLRREKQGCGSVPACTPVRQETQPNRSSGTKYSAEPCRREGAYQERTCPTENAARRSFFARRALLTLLVEALGRLRDQNHCGSVADLGFALDYDSTIPVVVTSGSANRGGGSTPTGGRLSATPVPRRHPSPGCRRPPASPGGHRHP